MIKENLGKIFKRIPSTVSLVAATKERTVEEIEEGISAGVKIIGENYLKEAKEKMSKLGKRVRWHFIGHLQKNKAKAAVKIFDLIETLDSIELAQVLDKECKKINKLMPVLIEVNSGLEPQKSGILPEAVQEFYESILKFNNLKPQGLMTMGPWLEDPEKLRPYFKQTKDLFEVIKVKHPQDKDWQYLSMGMSDSYEVAIAEGANMVRIGTAIFGKR